MRQMDFSPISEAKAIRYRRSTLTSSITRSEGINTSLKSQSLNSSPSPAIQHVIDGFVLLDASNADLPEHARRIIISSHQYNSVQHDDLHFFENLEYLDVSENRLDVFDFMTLPKLKSLGLAYNHIQQIIVPPNIDSHDCYLNLLSLDLSFNRIHPDCISELKLLPCLTELDLSHNELIDLPQNMYTLQSVERCILEHNHLSDQANFLILSYMPSLRHLSVANNLFSQIPSQSCEVQNFKQLSTLDISCNYFSKEESLLPLSTLYRLNEVMLYGNPLLGPRGEDPLHIYIEGLEQEFMQAREGREDQPVLVSSLQCHHSKNHLSLVTYRKATGKKSAKGTVLRKTCCVQECAYHQC